MSKSKNTKYGYDRQDAVITRFRRDARSSNNSSAVMQCIKRTKSKKVQPKEVIEFSWRELVNK
jgi:hypothetical protein